MIWTPRNVGKLLLPPRFAFNGAAAGQHAAQRDPFFSSVSLLLRCDGANNSTTFRDLSPIAHTVTANGNAKVSTAQSMFGGASCLLDGTGDYLSIPNHASLQFSGDFTVEMYFRAVGFVDNQKLFSTGNGGTAGNLAIQAMATGKIRVFNGVTQILETSTTYSTATWYLFGLTRSGTTVTAYTNRSSAGSGTSSQNFNATTSKFVGHDSAGADWNGYIDLIRVTKGVARTTATMLPVGAF